MNKLNQFQPDILAILRIVIAFLFIQHGTAKFFEFPVSMTGGNGSVELLSAYGIAGILEIIGGILLLIGLFTRLTAFILSGQMAVAYFYFHASSSTFFTPMRNEGELAIVFCFIFLYFFFTGAGNWSLDKKLNIQ